MLAGCATAQTGRGGLAFYDAVPPLAPYRLHADRFFDITVCLRPFRAAGPRFDVETVAGKKVVHNYGHGGGGWSLSWGSAEVVVPRALEGGGASIAVIGCGALGLTAATVALRAGVPVTIYAKEVIHQARSSRATGTWSPDSRVALAKDAPAGFAQLWEQMARVSFKTYRSYLGLPGKPVEFTDRYGLSDIPPAQAREEREAADIMHFAQYGRSIADLTPRPEVLPPGSHPFPVRFVQRNTSLQFNVADYGHTLLTDFLLAGGKLVMREFNSPQDLASLPEPVVINCTGYGARALWRDESVIPVRGQIAWLIPQPEVTYGLSYRNVTLLPRSDGIVLQNNGGGEAQGFNDANETVDRAEAEAGLKVYTDLYARMRSARG
jgi:glycine/D-amino acid oxidase-like deaminating enzyme